MKYSLNALIQSWALLLNRNLVKGVFRKTEAVVQNLCNLNVLFNAVLFLERESKLATQIFICNRKTFSVIGIL